MCDLHDDVVTLEVAICVKSVLCDKIETETRKREKRKSNAYSPPKKSETDNSVWRHFGTIM